MALLPAPLPDPLAPTARTKATLTPRPSTGPVPRAGYCGRSGQRCLTASLHHAAPPSRAAPGHNLKYLRMWTDGAPSPLA